MSTFSPRANNTFKRRRTTTNKPTSHNNILQWTSCPDRRAQVPAKHYGICSITNRPALGEIALPQGPNMMTPRADLGPRASVWHLRCMGWSENTSNSPPGQARPGQATWIRPALSSAVRRSPWTGGRSHSPPEGFCSDIHDDPVDRVNTPARRGNVTSSYLESMNNTQVQRTLWTTPL